MLVMNWILHMNIENMRIQNTEYRGKTRTELSILGQDSGVSCTDLHLGFTFNILNRRQARVSDDSSAAWEEFTNLNNIYSKNKQLCNGIVWMKLYCGAVLHSFYDVCSKGYTGLTSIVTGKEYKKYLLTCKPVTTFNSVQFCMHPHYRLLSKYFFFLLWQLPLTCESLEIQNIKIWLWPHTLPLRSAVSIYSPYNPDV